MEQEVWKDIPGYEGIYQVSTLGFVRSLDRKCEGKCIKGKMVTRHINSHNGYYYVRLGDKTKSVHRLVALTFIPNPENKPCVGHKDTNRQNPRVENLEWVTYSENNYNPITLAKNSESTRKRMSNSSTRKHLSDTIKAMYRQKSDYAKSVSEATRKAMRDPVVLGKISKGVEMLLNGVVIARFNSVKEASRETKHCANAIAKWCNGFDKKKNPYEWRFI